MLRLGPRVLGAVLLLAAACPAGAAAFMASAHGNQGLLPQQCGSCHVGHGPSQTTMLPGSQEATCRLCHGDAASRSLAQSKGLLTSTQGLLDVLAEFVKPSHHPLQESTRGSARLAYPRVAGAAPGAVNCTSCHDAHYGVKAPKYSVLQIKGMTDARGRFQAEYTLCFRCHGINATASGLLDIQRLASQGNPSFHPVQALGRNSLVPSLILPYTVQAYTACTDCHGSDQASGPRGPHGSAFVPILKANYNRDDGRPEGTFEYALCYTCHSRSVVLSESSFRHHRLHVQEVKASCYACHNSHGSTLYTHLISFDTRVVFPNGKGVLRFEDRGTRKGACSLRCHGENHDQRDY